MFFNCRVHLFSGIPLEEVDDIYFAFRAHLVVIVGVLLPLEQATAADAAAAVAG